MPDHTHQPTTTTEAPASHESHSYGLPRSFLILAFVTLVVFVLVKAKAVLVPLVFAAVAAMLMQGLVKRMSNVVPRGVAIAITALGMFGVLAAIVGLIGQQAAEFSSDLPAIQEKALELLAEAQTWLADVLGIQEKRLAERLSGSLDGGESSMMRRARNFFGTFTAFAADLLLFFVYYILILNEQHRLRHFVLQKAPPGEQEEAKQALNDVQSVAGEYVRGRAFLVALLFAVYAIGFWWAGLKFAFVVAAIAALFSVVPYVGNLAATVFVLVVAALSDDFANTALICLGIIIGVQVLESYVLTPLIVGKGVHLNPLSTILAVIAFGAIWGLPGAILAIPIVAILRQTLAHLPNGEPWGLLLGDEPLD